MAPGPSQAQPEPPPPILPVPVSTPTEAELPPVDLLPAPEPLLQPELEAEIPLLRPPEPEPPPAPERLQPDKPVPSIAYPPYKEAARRDLRLVAGNSTVRGRKEYLSNEAAWAFARMREAAIKAGVRLLLISGFRDRTRQARIFAKQIARKGSLGAALQLVAPPGFSEHHTGYAMDLGDALYPKTHLETTFENTPAFRWLSRSAARFGFELSYPPGNAVGVSYEPWHWRYVGSKKGKTLFSAAKGR
ncbi:M15 family metallopeptidase [Gloeobacter morelensis]|uniref:D-alanyl-D-alanine carboxypeptidase family protein n=1 Tax=Gloeobacter morelensis MG652769 TaxID=2781736 RepID=A0ABY3PHM0_9CYAN|nr:M15 family metallopeptidase [Gloeobacter morelensis]UFP93111.1 D-alanyl-D-alanine carboxypeptidase family protein [Gloeobacter morelensis MG652769]